MTQLDRPPWWLVVGLVAAVILAVPLWVYALRAVA
jgi:hypothetical protein